MATGGELAMVFARQVFALSRSASAVAVAVIAPVILVIQGPLNFVMMLVRAAGKPGADVRLATLADPLFVFVIASLKAIVGLALVGWITQMLVREMEDSLPVPEYQPARPHSIVAGAVTGIVYVLGVVLGLALLVAPGVALLVRGAACIPIAVAERRGPIDALRRSFELTRGWHWQIQGILATLVMLGAATVAMLLAASMWIPGGTTVAGFSIALTVANVVGWTTVMAVATAIYVRLAVEEELGYFPGEAIGVPEARAPSDGSAPAPGRPRLLIYAAVALCVLAGLSLGAKFLRSTVVDSSVPEHPPELVELVGEPNSGAGASYAIKTVDRPRHSAVSGQQSRNLKPWSFVEPAIGGYVVGSLTDTHGEPVAGAIVVAIARRDWLPRRTPDGTAVATRGDGTFRAGPLPAGTYAVEVKNLKSSRYDDFAARPQLEVQVVATGDSEPVDLKLERLVTVELPYAGAENRESRGGHKYFVSDPLRPPMDGFARTRLLSVNTKGAPVLTTLPGVVRLSPDPCFHPRSDVHAFEVKADGSLASPVQLPRPAVTATSIRLTRADGKALGEYTGRLIHDCTPPHSYSTIPARTSTGSLISVGANELYRARTQRGVTWRAVVMAEGCRVAESEPFTSGPHSLAELSLQCAPAASVTFQVTGLPAEAEEKVSPENFMVMYRSPRGIFSAAPEGWQIQEGRNKVMSFDALPKGERIHVHFLQRGVQTFAAHADIEISYDAHFELEAYEVAFYQEPVLWNGDWYTPGFRKRIEQPAWASAN